MTAQDREQMTDTQYDRVLDAIRSLDDKFTTALNTGLATLNAALLALSETHHRAQLEQERRNSTFATAEQVRQLTARVDQFSTEAGGREARISQLEQRMLQGDDHDFLRQSSATGYLITALVSIAAVTLAFVLAHAAGVH
jgi:hypothetical protein